MNTSHRIIACALLLTLLAMPQRSSAAEPVPPAPSCVTTGWDSHKVSLKDHTVFSYRGVYYIASIAIAPSTYETNFAYARSTDLCHWEDLGLILNTGYAPPWDAWRVWAPYVVAENGTYYMFYTGVSKDVTQSIMLATSINPADPLAWQPHGVVFQPNHPGMNWPGLGHWSDARDPAVLKVGNRYYMYYTGGDASGGIVGLATAPSMLGPWQDLGATVRLAPGEGLPESLDIVQYGSGFYLLYHRGGSGAFTEMRVATTPTGPWSAAQVITPGWAHKFWQLFNTTWMTSYLVDNTIVIGPVAWDDVGSLPRPFVASHVWHVWLPLNMRANQLPATQRKHIPKPQHDSAFLRGKAF